MEKKYVPSGVCLMCDKGTLPGMLTVLSNLTTEIYGVNLATESDKTPLNITPMGVCAMTRVPCVVLPMNWSPLQDDVLIGGQRLLLEDSKLRCNSGGQISILFVAPPALPAPPEMGLLDQVDAKLAELGPAGDTLRFQMGVAEGVVGGVVSLAEGLWSLGKLAVKANIAVLDAMAHPVETAQAAWHGAEQAADWASKGENWNKAWDSSQEMLGKADQAMYDAQDWVANGGIQKWASKQSPRDWGKLGGRGGFEAVMLFGTAGLGEVANAAGKAGKVASLAEKGVELASLTEKGAEAVNAAGKLERLGPVTTGAEKVAAKTAAEELAAKQAAEKAAQEAEAIKGAAKDKRVCEKDPVDVATGAMLFDAVDCVLPGPVPFVWERTWYSNSDRRGPLGHGWHHRYDLALWPDEAGRWYMRLADGRLGSFGPLTVENDFCAFLRAEQLELRPAPDQTGDYLVFSSAEQLTYRFAAAPAGSSQAVRSHRVLRAVGNAHGQAVRFAYSPQGHLTGITDSAGRAVGIRTDAAGRILALDVPNADGTPGTFAAVQYAYDGDGNLVRATDAEGHAAHFAYQGHLLTQKTFRTGARFYFEYDEQRRCIRTWGDENYFNGRFVYGDGHTVLLEEGPATRQEYFHRNGLVTRHVDPVGAVREWYYNAHDELELARDPLGRTTLFDYDGHGRLVATTRPGGIVEQTSYDPQGRPVAATDANGGVWCWEYDAAGQLLARTDPAGATTRYAYDDHGRAAEVTDALGHATRLRYDACHNLAHVAAPDGSIRSRGYDALGRLTALTDARGHVQRRRYDRLGQLVEVREPDGTGQQLAYDGEGNAVRVGDGRQAVEYAYTSAGQLALRRQGGQAVRFQYDWAGRLTELANEHDERYRFALDAAGQVAEEVGFDGLTRRYERDAAGRVVQVLRPGGRTTGYTYDPAGRVVAVVHNGNETTRFAYRPDGALLEAATNVATVRFERDTLGRVLVETQNGHEVISTYDPLGRRTGLASSLGAAVGFERDALGQVRQTQAGNWQSVVGRDADGLELQRQLSGGLSLGWQRDALGRPTSQRVSTGAGVVARQRRYQWQGADQLLSIEDSEQGTSQFTYDAVGSLAGATFAGGASELRQPDAVGNLFRSRERADRRYDKGGQLQQAGGARYKYDDEGNLTRKTLAGGQLWHYAWDGGGQLVSVTRPDGYAVTFTYDALGRRISKRFRGRVTRWVWDGDKPLHEWSELEVGPGSGSVQDLATWLFEDDSFAPAAKLTAQGAQSVVCDHLGTPLSMYDVKGQATWEMTLDSYGGVRQGRGKAQDCPFRYQGQYEDVETGLYYNRFRYYDPGAGQYISQDPTRLDGGYNLYGYVKNVNSWVDVLGLSGDPQSAAQAARLKEFYTTAEKANPVVESLSQTGSLPPNYVTKAQAAAQGWEPGKAIGSHIPGAQIGGDIFHNTTGVLPNAPGRVWYEADVGLSSTMKRSKQLGTRLLYSNDGLTYVTSDHYTSVSELGNYKICP